MTQFLMEVRIYPDDGSTGAVGDPAVTAEELAAVLANSTASEALADGLGRRSNGK
jgi:hypothetical protein